ncbi:hypothetical protein GURKE_01150 [Brevundimonas phage vB_BpoS-Gurke]|uniref:Uncharacterized protein n=1 Tax=Brevundimonas phage vB_BpoS-Gurke TaxID=2948599 RepID=A0A9E7SRX1_9CAUD|nr:hypothetical protein GURKE_01150 [Brevundimonas phage vB_BpoS-Gurke]
MKNGRLQAKDFPDRPLVEFIASLNGRWGTWCWSDSVDPTFWDHSVAPLFPEDTPDKLIRAKMAGLIRRGVIDGCPCGCRGDYEITDQGRAYLTTLSAEPPCPPEHLERARRAARG